MTMYNWENAPTYDKISAVGTFVGLKYVGKGLKYLSPLKYSTRARNYFRGLMYSKGLKDVAKSNWAFQCWKDGFMGDMGLGYRYFKTRRYVRKLYNASIPYIQTGQKWLGIGSDINTHGSNTIKVLD